MGAGAVLVVSMSLHSLPLPPLVAVVEDKLQHWRPIRLGYAEVGYKIERGESANAHVTQWPSELFGCCTSTDAGWNCFWVHSTCCGQYWVYSSAYALVGLGNEASQVATARLFSSALNASNNEAAGAIAGGVQLASNFMAGRLRYKLFQKLYDRPERPATNPETSATTCLAQTCCIPCAIVQEVDAIMVAVRHKAGIKLVYGPCCTRYCCDLVEAGTNPPRIIKPGDVSMGMRGPGNARMQRQWAPSNLMGLPSNAITQQRGRENYERQRDEFEQWQQQR